MTLREICVDPDHRQSNMTTGVLRVRIHTEDKGEVDWSVRPDELTFGIALVRMLLLYLLSLRPFYTGAFICSLMLGVCFDELSSGQNKCAKKK